MKIKYIISLIALMICTLIVLPACDVLDQPAEDFLEYENYFTSEEAAIASVNAISRFYYIVAYGSWSQWTHRITDDATNPTYWAIARQNEIAHYRADGSNTEILRHWRELYKYIVYSNFTLTGVDQMASDQISQEVKNWIMGEAYVWRAWSYFKLTTVFGEVPLVLTNNMEGLEDETPQSTVAEIYAQIISDLTEAEQLLPAVHTSEHVGRPIQTTATSLLSRVYMQLGNFEKGAEYAKKVIDTGRHMLVDDFNHAFIAPYQNGPEHIWSYQSQRRPIGLGNSHAFAFAAPRGSRFLTAPGQAGLASYVPTIEAFNAFEEGDYRRDVSFITEYEDVPGQTVVWQDFQAPVPHIYKYSDRTLSFEINQDANKPLVRYADILLLYAEALNELGQTGEALTYLNMIRERARNGDPDAVPQDYAPGISQDEFRDAVRLERRLELMFEGHRVRDLQRWGTMIEAIRALGPPADGGVNKADFIQNHHVLWPKPTVELELNPFITQNPGY